MPLFSQILPQKWGAESQKSGEKVRFSRKIKKNHKKMHFFCEKFWRIKNLPYICSVKRKQTDDNTKNWSIHLRARIPASHAGHRGSNPLSTTKRRLKVVFFHLVVLGFLGCIADDNSRPLLLFLADSLSTVDVVRHNKFRTAKKFANTSIAFRSTRSLY